MRTTLCALLLALPSIAIAQHRAQSNSTPAKHPRQPPGEHVENAYPLDLQKIGIRLPRTNDPELRRLFTSTGTVFYKLPQVWQHYVPASRIEEKNLTTGETAYYTRSHRYGLYHASYLPEFHANANFPWETTVGLNTSFKKTNNPYRTINFINLPRNEETGKFFPVLVVSDYPVKWIYPAGTTVGEIIYVTHRGRRYIQEVRTRQKSTDSIDWEPAMYRPIISQEEYELATGQKSHEPSKKYFHFRNPQETEVFAMEGLVERLPALSEDKVKELLSKPFKAVDIDDTWSPAADQDFHILPRDYCLDLLGGVDSHTCASCHRQTQISVRNLTPRDPDVVKNPLKVGNIRGCDAVFSWHPFKMASVKRSPEDKTETVSLREYDRQKGFVVLSERNRSYGEQYKLTEFVQAALKDYELPPKQFIHDITPGDDAP